MLIFSDNVENPDKRGMTTESQDIRSSVVQQTTSKKRKKNLSKENFEFLKSLGLSAVKKSKK